MIDKHIFLRKNDFPPRRAKISWWFIVDTVGILKAIKIISRFRRLRRMCLACLNSSQFAFCLRRSFAGARFLHLDGEEKFIEKEFPSSRKAIKRADFRSQLVRKAGWSWMVRRSHRNRAKNKPRLSSAFGEIRAEQQKKKLICGWFYSQKKSKAKMESCLCKGWIYATRMNIVLVK